LRGAGTTGALLASLLLALPTGEGSPVAGSGDAWPDTAWVEGYVFTVEGATVPRCWIVAAPKQRSGDPTYITHADDEGHYLLAAPPSRYTVGARLLTAHGAYYPDAGVEFVSLAGGDTLRLDLDARFGRAMEVYGVRLDGAEIDTLDVGAGEGIEVECDVRLWVPYNLPLGDEHIGAGVEGEGQDFQVVGRPGTYPGLRERVRFQLTAPDTPGPCTAYIHQLSIVDTHPDSLARTYRRDWQRSDLLFIPIGTLVVSP